MTRPTDSPTGRLFGSARPFNIVRLLSSGLGRSVLMYFLTVVLLSLFIAGVAINLGNVIAAQEAQQSQLYALANARQEQVDAWLVTHSRALSQLADEDAVRGYIGSLTSQPSDSPVYKQALVALTDRLIQLKGNQTEFENLFVMGTDGVMLYATEPAMVGRPLFGEDGLDVVYSEISNPASGLKDPLKLAEWTSPPYYARDVGVSGGVAPHVVRIQRVTRKSDGNPIGFIGAWFYAEGVVTRIVETPTGIVGTGAQSNPQIEVYLVDHKQRPVSGTRYNKLLVSPVQAYASVLINKALALPAPGETGQTNIACITYSTFVITDPTTWWAVYNNYEGKSVLGAACRLKNLEAVIIAEQQSDAAFAVVNNNLRIGGILLVLIAFLSVIPALIFAQRLTAPIAELTETTARVASGQLDQQVRVTRTDEIGQLAHSFNRMTEQLRGVYSGLESTVARRTEQLRLSAEVSRAVSELTDIGVLLPQVVELIRERYDFYYVGLFLLDDLGAWAVLRAGTGEAGRTMLGRGHKLEVGGRSMVGSVVAQNQARIALDVGEEPVRFNNPLLPETRSEAALPLRAGGRLLGVIDVQSTRSRAFSDEDLVALQNLADQVAVAIDNARLYSDQKLRSEQRQRVVDIAQRAAAHRELDDMLQSAAELTRGTFNYYNVNIVLVEGNELALRASAAAAGSQRLLIGQRFPLGTGVIGAAVDGHEALLVTNVADDARFYFLEALPDTRSELAVPLRQGDRVIGALDIESDRVNGLDQGDVDLMQTLGGLLAVAIENVQLYQQTAASLNEVSALYRQYTRENWQSANVGTVEHTHILPGEPSLGAAAGVALTRSVDARAVVTFKANAPDNPTPYAGVSMPINLRGETIGALALFDSERQREWTDDELTLLQSASNELGLALENARLFRQTQDLLQGEQERRRLADTLREVAEAVSSTLKLDELLNLIIDQMQKVLQFDSASVQLLEGDELVIIGGRGFADPERVIGLHFPLRGNNPNFEVFERRAPFILLNPQERYEHMRYPPHDKIRSWMGIPLIYGESMLGMLTLDSGKQNAFSPEQAELALAFANQASSAIQNARLFEESQKRAQQFATLNEISRAVSSALSLEQVLEVIYQQTRRVVPTDGFFVALYDDVNDQFIYELVYDKGERFPRFVNRVDQASNLFRSIVEKHAVTVLYSQAEYDERRSRLDGVGSGDIPASLIFTPLLLGDKVIGAVSAQSYELNRYTSEHSDMLGAIAVQTASAVQNARLFEETQRRAQQFATLNEISRAVSSALSLEEVLTLIYEQTRRVIEVDGFFIALYDEKAHTLSYDLLYDNGQRYPAETRPVRPGSNGEIALQERRTVRVIYTPEEIEELSKAVDQTRIADTSRPPASLVYTPLMLGERPIGVMSAQTYELNSYSEEDADLLGAIANQAAAAIQNARLFDETQRRAEELAALNEISRAVSSVLSVEDLAAALHRQVERLMPASSFYIALYIAEKDEIFLPYVIEEGEVEPQERYQRTGITGYIIEQGQPLLMRTREEQEKLSGAVALVGKASQSYLGVPLFYGDKVIGVMAVQSYTAENVYGPEELRILSAVAQQAAVAVQNARLFEQAGRRAAQLTTLNEIGRAVSAAQTLEQVLEVIYERARDLIPSDVFYVALFDAQAQRFVYEFLYDSGQRFPREVGESLEQIKNSYVLRTFTQRHSLRQLFTRAEHLALEADTEVSRIGDTKRVSASMLFVPLMLGDEAIGVISAQTYAYDSYNDEHEQLLGSIATQASAAIQNARLFEQSRRRAEELAVLNEISRALSAVLSFEELYQVLHQQVSRLMDTTSFYIALYDAPTQMVSIPYMIEQGRRESRQPRPVSRGLTGYVIRTRQAMNVKDQTIEAHAQLGIELVGTPALCWMGVPLFLGDQVLGIISVQSYERTNVFDDNHMRILQAVANQAAIAVQNARLFEATQRRTQELTSLYDLGAALASRLEFTRLRDIVFDQVLRLTGASAVSLALGPDDKQNLVLHTLDTGKPMPERVIPVDDPQSLTAYIARTRNTLLIRDLPEEREHLPAYGHMDPGGETPRSWLGVPLLVGQRTVGVIVVQSYDANQFDQQQEQLLRQVAVQVAISLENARLFESTEQARRQAEERLRESMALQSISRSVSRTLEQSEVLDIVLDQIIHTLGFEFSVISLVDEREGMIKAVRGRGVSEAQIANAKRRLDDPDIMADVIRTGRTEVISDYDPRFDREMYDHEGHADLVRIWTPIVSRGRNIGLVEAGHRKSTRAAIGENEVRLLQAFVDQAAVGIENARLFAETQRRAIQLSTAAEISRAATSILDPEQLVRDSVELIRERFSFYYVAVFLLDPDSRFAVLKEATGEAGRVLKERGHKLEIGGQSMVGSAIGGKRARIALDVGAEAVRFANPLLPDTRSEIALPLRVGDRVVGALDAQSTLPGAFSQEDVDILQSMADQLATAIDNARLFQDSLARTREVTALFDAGQQINATLELDSLFEVVARRLLEATNVEAATVSDWDADNNRVITRSHVSASPDVLVDVVGTSYGLEMYPLRRQALTEATPMTLHLADTQTDPHEVQLMRRARMGTLLFLPLTVRDNVVGLVMLYDNSPTRRFSANEIRFASTLVNQAAVAIQNARLFAETQISLAETAALYQAGRAITAALTPAEILSAIMDNVAPPDIDRAVLMLFTGERKTHGVPEILEAVAAWGPRAGERPLGRFTLEQVPLATLTNPYAPMIVEDARNDPRVDQRSRSLMQQQQLRSAASVPLTLAGSNEWIGILLVQVMEPRLHRFNDREVRLYHTLSGQAAVQVDRRRAERALARRANQLAASAEVSRAAASILDVDQLLRQTVELIRERFGFYHAQVFLLDESGRNLMLRASTGAPGRDLLADGYKLAPTAESLVGWVLVNGQVRVTSAGTEDPFYRTHPRLPEMRSELGIPLSVGGRVLGVLDVQSTEMQAFGQEDSATLSTLADQIGVAISNARLFTESSQRITDLGLLFDVTTAASASTRLDEVLQGSAQALQMAMPDSEVAIYLRDPSENVMNVGALAGFAEDVDKEMMVTKLGQGVVGWVGLMGQPALIGDVRSDTRYREVDPRMRSELAVPLIAGQQVIGVLNVESPQVEAFGQEQLRLFTTLSSTLASAIQNARLFEEVQAANVRLREVDRLKSEFLASMSHELRTPLNSIIGFSRVILKGIDGPLTELQTIDLTAIHSSGQHLLGLINDILDLSKIEAGKLELAFDEVNVADIVKGVMSSAVGLTKDRPIELRQEVPADLPKVWADQIRVRQVLLNLVSNATKFTDQGSITVRAEVITDRPLGVPDDSPERIDFVRLSVVDTGIGIAEKDLPKLFQAFQQVDASSSRRAGGTGLGLNITKQLVEMHGGRIGLSSTYGHGSTFWFAIPTKRYEPPPVPVEPATPTEEPQDTRRVVLAVDDDPGVVTLYKRYLEPQGYRVVAVSRSDEVLAKARELKPFVITLDVLMPHKDGWQVIQELKRDPDTRDIPVVMASIVADQGRGFSLGAADYLVKPILEQDLVAALKRINGSKKEHTILVIDDEADNIRLVKRVLEGDAHYRVLEAQSGREGLEAVKRLRPDVIVLDLMMPGLDGFAVLSALKSDPETRQIPVIVVTAKDLTAEDRERLNGHVGALLRKGPLTESELLQDVMRMVQKADQKRSQSTEQKK